jgi:DNA-binding NarL/FixJ family response regulator
MIRVMVVDDHPVVQAGMRLVLEAADNIAVVGEGASGADALRLVKEHQPDVLVLDVNLPDLNGLEVTQTLRDRGETAAILVLTVQDDEATVFGLLQAGASGYVLKDEALETLVRAVQATARGDSWLSPAVARQVVRRSVEGLSPQRKDSCLPLTPRELQVLRLLAQGLDNSAIAQALTVTRRTVQNHVSSIYGKLEVRTRTQAALFAIRLGLVEVTSTEDGEDGT